MPRPTSQEYDGGTAKRRPKRAAFRGFQPGDSGAAVPTERVPKRSRDGVGGRADLNYDPKTGRKLKR